MSSFDPGCRNAVLLSAGLLALWPAAAHAQIVVLNASACASREDYAGLQRALEVELSAEAPPLATGAGPALSPPERVVVSVECDRRPKAMTLRISTSRSREIALRSIELGDVPDAARPRLLALVIAETLSAEPPPSSASGGERPPSEPPAPAALAAPARPIDAGLFTTEDPYAGGRAIELGVASQARLALSPSTLLLAFEANASGPIGRRIAWGIEASYATADETWTPRGTLDVRWASAALGFDVATPLPGLAIGPRFSIGYLRVMDHEGAAAEATLVSQIGARARFAVHVAGETSLAVMLAAQRSVGALALGTYTGLDTPFQGWLLSWGLGIAFEP